MSTFTYEQRPDFSGKTLVAGTEFTTSVVVDTEELHVVKWFKVTDEGENLVSTGNEFRIESVSASDAGNYKVAVHDNENDLPVALEPLTFQLEVLPTDELGIVEILETSKFVDSVDAGTDIVIKAKHTHHESIGVNAVWKFTSDGEEYTTLEDGTLDGRVSTNVETSIDDSGQTDTYEITIRNVTKSDEGFYKLEVSQHGSLLSLVEFKPTTGTNEIAVTVANPADRLHVSITGLTPTIDENGLRLSVATDTNADEVTFQWQYRKTARADFKNITGATSQDYDLATAEIKPTSEGFYRVVVTGKKGAGQEDVRSSDEYQFKIENVPFYGIVLREELYNQVLNEGDTLTMGTQGLGAYPDAYTINWTKDGTPFRDVDTEELTFDQVDKRDEGTYVLNIMHNPTRKTRQYTYNISVQENEEQLVLTGSNIPDNPFTFNTREDHGTYLGDVREGDEAYNIQVVVAGSPTKLQWFYLPNGEEKAIEGQTGNQLVATLTHEYANGFFLRAYYETDTGEVTRDSEKYTYSSFTYKPVTGSFKNVAHSAVTVEEEQPLRLEVEFAPNDEQATIKWHRLVEGEVKPIENDNADTLVIDPVTLEDTGEYHAVITRFGITRDLRVNVKVIPKPQPRDIKLTLPHNITSAENVLRVPEGTDVTVPVNVDTPTETTTYRWFFKATNREQFADLLDQTSQTLTLAKVTEANSGSYYMDAVDTDSSKGESLHFKLEVIPKPEDQEDTSATDTTTQTPPSNQGSKMSQAVDSQFINFTDLSLTTYVNAMKANRKIDPKQGLNNQLKLNTALLAVINHKDSATFMAAMDKVVDIFWEYRMTVFHPRYRARFLEYAPSTVLSQQAKDTFVELLNVFSWMAFPNNDQGIQPMLTMSKRTLSGTAFARLAQYYDRKLKAGLNSNNQEHTPSDNPDTNWSLPEPKKVIGKGAATSTASPDASIGTEG